MGWEVQTYNNYIIIQIQSFKNVKFELPKMFGYYALGLIYVAYLQRSGDECF